MIYLNKNNKEVKIVDYNPIKDKIIVEYITDKGRFKKIEVEEDDLKSQGSDIQEDLRNAKAHYIKMNDREKEIKRKYGYRAGGGQCTPLFSPAELGYRCPEGHSYIEWSEFNEHIWCYPCKKDYHYARECFLIKYACNPKDLPEQPPIITTIKNFAEDGNAFNDVPKNLIPKRDKEAI